MTDSNIPTVTVRETVTATASATTTAGFNQGGRPMHPPPHPFPHAFGGPIPAQFPPPFIPMGGLPPAIQPGSVVSPFAAVLCILTVAGCYWAFRYLPNLNQSSNDGSSSASTSGDKDDKDKEKDKDKSSGGAADTSTGSPMVAISPAAFISLFCFALLAIVIIQGPLGMAEAFNSGKDTGAQSVSSSAHTSGGRLGLKKILDLLQPQAPSRSQPLTGTDQPMLGGQHHAVGPNGAASASWYINQGGAPGTPGMQKPAEQPDLTVADRLTLAGLPTALQTIDLCRAQPATCAALLGSLDPVALAQILSPDGLTTPGVGPAPIAKPIPLIPQHGFMGSYQGLKSLENAFYPMLIGAIGLIVLFDYGT